MSERPQEGVEALRDEVAGQAPVAAAPARPGARQPLRRGAAGRRPPLEPVEQVVEGDARVVAKAHPQARVVDGDAPLVGHAEREGPRGDVVDVHPQLEDQVRALDHPPHAGVRRGARVDAHDEGMRLVDAALAHHRLDDRRAEPLGEGERPAAAVAPQHADARPDDRAPRRGQAVARVGDGRRHALRAAVLAGRPRAAPVRRRRLVEQVARHLEVQRAVPGHAAVERSLEVLDGRLQVVEQERLADDLGEGAPRGVDVVAGRVVQAPSVALAQAGAAGDQDDRDALGVRAADGRRRRERPDAEGRGRGAQAALAGVAVGGVDGGLLAGRVDHRHPALVPDPEQPEDEVPRHAEHVPHAAPAQGLDQVLAERLRGLSAGRHGAGRLRRAGRR